MALHQAGQGMCQNMTILGLGQILIPSYPEGGINGTSVQGLKVGSVIPPSSHETLNSDKLDNIIEAGDRVKARIIQNMKEALISKNWKTTFF